MKIVVIGGGGLIGTRLVRNLRQRAHEVVAASPASGVNTLTGEGLPRRSLAPGSWSMSRTHPRSRTTQFFEFANRIAHSATDGQVVRLPPALVRPIAADDVAESLALIALDEPVNGMIELAGPELIRLDELVRRVLTAHNDSRQVMADVHSMYFGTVLNDQSLTPGEAARIGPTRLDDWLGRTMAET